MTSISIPSAAEGGSAHQPLAGRSAPAKAVLDSSSLAPAWRWHIGLTALSGVSNLGGRLTIGLDGTFIGLDNYRALMSRGVLPVSCGNTFIWSFCRARARCCDGPAARTGAICGRSCRAFCGFAVHPVLLSYRRRDPVDVDIQLRLGILNAMLRAGRAGALASSWLGDQV